MLLVLDELQLSEFVQQLIQYPSPTKFIFDCLQFDAGIQPLEINEPPGYLIVILTPLNIHNFEIKTEIKLFKIICLHVSLPSAHFVPFVVDENSSAQPTQLMQFFTAYEDPN